MHRLLTIVDQPDRIHRVPVTDGVHTLLAAARREVIALSTLSGAGGIRHEPPARRGLRYRAVFPDSARNSAAQYRRLSTLALGGVDVRTMPEVPIDALVIDGSIAVLPADSSTGNVLVLRLPSVVTTATELFERIWPVAVPLAAGDPPTDADVTDRERDLLRLLALGATDEVTAAQLGISVRTVRRSMAQLMHRLGARSRFQAGVKAADRGWLVDPASNRDHLGTRAS
ncbi:helix-turn-helix transcriptional regulator [Kribbella deserti]|uniref:LuxR C-terminal-related transcriptional regulator n=1 Tax=Kribbella deserti TaxID=1926257 RepID=A0ABV6QGU9_9ACTN